ncbi:MAG TPA: YegS/Rv2252/BmrU family lipid kinase [Armatimonadota bacterium]|jgi:diacylglycerol kinase (ATP)|nr:YegS/Rv2252/BmrU family lipid kinase [Armatimonadota bacterium]
MDVLLFNPNAGGARKLGITAKTLLWKLGKKAINVELPHCGTEEEMIQAAAGASGRVIAAGGDGTVHALLQNAGQCGVIQLAIIPLGTANHLANALGIPSDVDSAIDIIAEGYSKDIDLGKVNGNVFSQAAGAGLHARAFHIYGERKDKNRMDAATAVISTYTEWKPQLMRVVIDGESYLEEVTQVTAANTPMYGGRFMIAPDAKVDDGLLDVVIVGSLNKIEIMQYGMAAMSGTLSQLPKTYTTKAKRIEIAAVREKEEIEVHADAQPVGYTPKTIQVLPRCLNIVVPKEKA